MVWGLGDVLRGVGFWLFGLSTSLCCLLARFSRVEVLCNLGFYGFCQRVVSVAKTPSYGLTGSCRVRMGKDEVITWV